jgi:hypothetical protein
MVKLISKNIMVFIFAFSCIFRDLVRRGLITGDQNLLDQFWRDFLRNLHKYPSKLAQ